MSGSDDTPEAKEGARIIQVVFFVGGLIAMLALFGWFSFLPVSSEWVAAMIGGWFVAMLIPGVRVLALLPVVLVAGPLLITRRCRCALPEIEEVAAMPEEIPDVLAQRFEEASRELEQEGLVSAGLFVMKDMAYTPPSGPRGDVVIACFEHPTRRHAASLLMTRRDGKFTDVFGMRFHQWLPDGSLLITASVDMPSMFPRSPRQEGINLPGVRSARELYEVHQRVLARFRAGGLPAPPAPDGWRAALEQENEWVFQDWEERGLLIRTGKAGEYRLSGWMMLRGAWGLTPPIDRIRRWLQRRQGERVRAEWGV